MMPIESNVALSRRTALQLGLGGLGAGMLPGFAAAQAAWPTKAVTLVVGYPPGGQTDFAGRVLTAGMQTSLGQGVVIDNKPGVNGNIATDFVSKSAPDGYRLLVGNGSNMVLNPHTYRNTAVADPLKLTPIGLLLTSSLMLVVPASLPVKNLEEFIAWVKAAGQGRQDGRLRLGRPRQPGADGDGALPRAHRQAQDEPRALQGQQPGDDRPDRRARPLHVRRLVRGRALPQVRPAQGR